LFETGFQEKNQEIELTNRRFANSTTEEETIPKKNQVDFQLL